MDFFDKALDDYGVKTKPSAPAPSAFDASAGLIRHFEGYRDTPYWDVNAYRIGYGSDTITDPVTGKSRRVQPGDKITRAEAEADLAKRIPQFQQTIQNQFPNFSKLPPTMQAALTSVGYNYGSLPKSVVRALGTGDLNSVADTIASLGANPGRREQEAAFGLGGVMPQGAAGTVTARRMTLPAGAARGPGPSLDMAVPVQTPAEVAKDDIIGSTLDSYLNPKKVEGAKLETKPVSAVGQEGNAAFDKPAPPPDPLDPAAGLYPIEQNALGKWLFGAPSTGREPWGALKNLSSHMTSGLGPEISAAGAAFRGGNYQNELQQQYADKAAYEQAHPGMALTTKVAGEAVPQTLATIAGLRGLAALGSRIPMLAAPAAFAAGTGGNPFLSGAASGALQVGMGTLATAGPRAAMSEIAPDSVPAAPEGSFGKELGKNMLFGAAVGGPLNALIHHFFPGSTATANPQVAQMAADQTVAGQAAGQQAAAAARAAGATDREAIEAGRRAASETTLDLPASAIIRNPETAAAVKELAGAPETRVAENFNRAIGRTFGADAEMAALGHNGLTPEVMTAAENRIRTGLDNFIQTAGPIAADLPLRQQMGSVLNDVTQHGADTTQARVRELIAIIRRNRQGGIQNGTLTPETFRTITGSDSELYHALSEPNVAPYARQLMNGMYDALARSNPNAAGQLDVLRSQYRHLMEVQGAVEKSGATGLISPPAIAKRLMSSDSATLQNLGRIAQFLPAVSAAGGAKPTLKQMIYGSRGMLAGAAGGGALGAYAADLGAPMLMGIGPMAAGGIGIGAGLAHLARSSYGRYLSSPAYLQRVIENTLQSPVRTQLNPLIPMSGFYSGGAPQPAPAFGGT